MKEEQGRRALLFARLEALEAGPNESKRGGVFRWFIVLKYRNSTQNIYI